MQPYTSTAAKQFAPGNFITSNRRIGVTRAIEDAQEANPRVLVKWMDDLSQEWVRSEYLYLANCQPRVTDNDKDEITVSLNGRELRGWSYASDDERRQKMLQAREYVEGWCDANELYRAA